jgi:hypothetical protein
MQWLAEFDISAEVAGIKIGKDVSLAQLAEGSRALARSLRA